MIPNYNIEMVCYSYNIYLYFFLTFFIKRERSLNIHIMKKTLIYVKDFRLILFKFILRLIVWSMQNIFKRINETNLHGFWQK